MRIHTQYVTNGSGTAQIRATGMGKQRTIAADFSKSNARNHGEAAGTLALVLIQGERSRQVAAKTAKHFVTGGKHTFTLGE